MLALRNTIRTTLLLGLAVVLFAGTAAGKSERSAQRKTERQAKAVAKTEQRQEKKQARVEQREVKQVQRQEKKQARVEQREVKQVQRQEKKQVKAEQRAVKQVQRQEKKQVKAEQRAVKQVQRQEKKQARVEQRDEKREQKAQVLAEKATAKNEAERTKTVNRDVNIQRIVGPNGKKIIKERNTQKTVTKNGRTYTKNVSRTVVRDKTKGFERPRVIRSNYNAGGNYALYNRGGRSAHVRRRFPGRRPGRIFNHIVWPSYGYPVYYRHGPDVFVHYVRPSYHRKYVFVSFGSYWPAYYSSVRYYWYGWHPYTWYGSYPTAYESGGDTYNYYTYNTYNYESEAAGSYTASEYSGPLESVDETTFEDVRQKLAEQAQEQPEPQTLVDKFFEEGVVAFEQEDYGTATKAFADAIALEPNDLILPFAYVQSLFASEQYSKATDILRLGLVQMPAEEQGLFFPRGLYSDDEILFGQIDNLKSRAETFSYDPDMPLLLGYQLIGVERYGEARQWLESAGQYDLNKDAAVILLDLLGKLEEQPQAGSENI